MGSFIIPHQLIGLPLAQMRKQFADLAHTESDCASAKKGGDYGRFKRGQREEAFEDAALMAIPINTATHQALIGILIIGLPSVRWPSDSPSLGRTGPGWQDAAFALDVGEMSDIVSSASGVHVILRVP